MREGSFLPMIGTEASLRNQTVSGPRSPNRGRRSGVPFAVALALGLVAPRMAAAREPVAGRAYRNSLGQRMVWIPPGSFTMGAADEGPRRKVRVDSGFWMGAHEVTQAEYAELVEEAPSHFSGPRRPVEGVSWEEARRFAKRLTVRERAQGRIPEGWVYSLPSEAQWEYAARAGGEAHLPPRQVERRAVALPWSRHQTALVGTLAPNAWGLHDMLGNVWEWCLDGYAPHLPRLETDDRPQGPSASWQRVTRGGSWMNGLEDIRLTFRLAHPRFSRWDHLGFRMVLVQEDRWRPEPVPEPGEVAPIPCAGGPELDPTPEWVADAAGLRLRWVRGEALGEGFWIGEREVTQAQYRGVMGENPSRWEGDDLPVERVSWADAMRFARRLGQSECSAGRVPAGWSYRLPRAEEWERAFELGGGRAIPEEGEGTRSAAQAEPDALGLRDMVGNVWEWCLDAPEGHGEGSMRRSIRGGSYRFVGVRSWTRRVVADPSVGFRVVLAPTRATGDS